MLDFLHIKRRKTNKGVIEVYPDFIVSRSKDLMILGGDFYAIWNFETQQWSTDEYVVRYLIDKLLIEFSEKLKETVTIPITTKLLSNYSSKSWTIWRLYISKLADQNKQLDEKITFSNSQPTKADYVSKSVSYPLEEAPTPAFDSLFGVLYSEVELQKILWAIGSIIAGESKDIQKFFVLFGIPGTGKSTTLNLIQMLFEGYYTTFEAHTLTSGSSSFAAEAFRGNPLIGINHEGDLSRIREASLLNSIVSHDTISMNVKYQHTYPMKLNTMLFIATNKPVNISEADSGLIRRLIDIRPTGNKVSPEQYDQLMSQIRFELGGIAQRALLLYNKIGKDYYFRYRPVDMMLRTNVVFNFVDEFFYDFKKEGHITLTQAWKMYVEYCDSANIKHHLPRYRFRDEFGLYWDEFYPYKKMNNNQYRSLFVGFKIDMFNSGTIPEEDLTDAVPVPSISNWLDLVEQQSVLDRELSNQPAKIDMYAPWDTIETILSEIDTTKEHYVLPSKNHIVIDLDIKDSEGNKRLDLNIEEALSFPPTYAELSRGGQGIHLHYEYDGDVSRLSRVYDSEIEVLAPIGKFAIRRKLTKCNNLPISSISSGLPLKEDQIVISKKTIKTERSLRVLVSRNLNKEVHPATRPSVDFIKKILEDAVKSGLHFDISDMKPAVIAFASNSTNQASECIKIALNLPYSNGSYEEVKEESIAEYADDRLVFFDVEVFSNLFLISWKFEGETTCKRMVNPSPSEIEPLLNLKLVGFNNRRYDNHILYARYIGYSLEDIYQLSQRIISNDRNALFAAAYNISYVDVYDYSSKKQSLKKWQLELGVDHKELDLPWDEPVEESLWEIVGEYCDHDTISTEIVHTHLNADFRARQILSELSSIPINRSTLSHTAKIIFGDDRRPQRSFVYTDLSEMFSGYTFNRGVSMYKDEVVGEGGYVYSRPGIYTNVLYMDIASMHPTSIELLNLFGDYTSQYSEIKKARLHIKHGELDAVSKMFNGRLKKYLDGDPEDLAYALKIVINIVYGLTFASFNNPFKDDRNKDNIVAKRGALFMVDLKHALQERNINVIHIKTDSVKIADYSKDDVAFVKSFGLEYGYDFEIEDVFDNMALLNDADLVGKREKDGSWVSVGARFTRPYVFKTLFSKQPIVFEDMVEKRAVKIGAMYLNMEHDGESLLFIGKVGTFCPVIKEKGGILLRIKDGKQYAVAGTKNHYWLPAAVVKGELEKYIDISYFRKTVDDTILKLSEVGNPSDILE